LRELKININNKSDEEILLKELPKLQILNGIRIIAGELETGSKGLSQNENNKDNQRPSIK